MFCIYVCTAYVYRYILHFLVSIICLLIFGFPTYTPASNILTSFGQLCVTDCASRIQQIKKSRDVFAQIVRTGRLQSSSIDGRTLLGWIFLRSEVCYTVRTSRPGTFKGEVTASRSWKSMSPQGQAQFKILLFAGNREAMLQESWLPDHPHSVSGKFGEADLAKSAWSCCHHRSNNISREEPRVAHHDSDYRPSAWVHGTLIVGRWSRLRYRLCSVESQKRFVTSAGSRGGKHAWQIS